MEYRRLGNSGLKVSAIGLGGNNFGRWADEPASIKVIEQALELGINFIDTAAMYSRGRSEEIVGKALRGKRGRVVIATKFGHFDDAYPAEPGGSRNHILRAVDQSLRRLGTDYIDLYYYHYPDMETPIAETLGTLDDLLRTGKVRYIACSNFKAWQLCEAMWVSRVHKFEPFIALQANYNIMERTVEKEVVPCCRAYNVALIPWGPLAGGFLTGKYRQDGGIPKKGRLADPPPIYQNLLTEANFEKLSRLEKFAGERGCTVAELSLAWLLSRPCVGSVIAGATSAEQLAANTAAAHCKLTAEDLRLLENIF